MNLMGLLGGLMGDKTAGSQEGAPLLMNLLTSLLNNPNGQTDSSANTLNGIQTMVKMFEESGLADQVQSWVGTGENHPVLASDILQVFGNTRIAQIAEQLGINPELASEQIASHLPGLIDTLTPNGQLPQNMDQISSLAQQFLGRIGKA